MQTVSDVCLRRICLLDTSTFSVLEVLDNYCTINLLTFTYSRSDVFLFIVVDAQSSMVFNQQLVGWSCCICLFILLWTKCISLTAVYGKHWLHLWQTPIEQPLFQDNRGKTVLDFNETRWWGGTGISWTICKSLQITIPAPHHLIFTGQMLFLTPSQQCQSTES